MIKWGEMLGKVPQKRTGSGKITIIPKPELRALWGGFPYSSPPFKVTNLRASDFVRKTSSSRGLFDNTIPSFFGEGQYLGVYRRKNVVFVVVVVVVAAVVVVHWTEGVA